MVKNTHTLRKVWLPISQALSNAGPRCIFQYYGKLMGKPKHFPCYEVYYRMGIWLEKCTLTMEKVWVPISQDFPRVLLHFPVLWEIDGEIHAFVILPFAFYHLYTTGWESNEKKHPYYETSMGTNFLGFARLMVLAEFSHTIGN